MQSSKQQLLADFGPFADPATEVKVEVNAHGANIQFARNAEEHRYFLDSRDNKLTARHLNNKVYPSVRSLLASTDFADLKSFVQNQNRMLNDFVPENLLEPDSSANGVALSKTDLVKQFSPVANTESQLKVVVLDGPAGVGKTSLIKFLVHRRIHSKDTSAPVPILHVYSRGRRLSNLNDVLAYSLQLMRAKFTYDQIPILIHHGLLQIAIDGFDELVDADGYKDSWVALREFLREIGKGGPVILAGRDSFFDEQAFNKNLVPYFNNLEVANISLHPTTTSKAKAWLATMGWPKEDIEDPFTNLVLYRGSYALRPYFLSELAKSKGWSNNQQLDLSPRQFLIEQFLRRESELITEKIQISAEKCIGSLNSLFEEIALEMRESETDAVDTGFLSLCTEYAFASSVSSNDLAKLQHRAGSLALLEIDVRTGFRRFPHTEISNHFLARALISKILLDVEPRFLRRSVLQTDFLTVLCEVLLSSNPTKTITFVQNVQNLFARERSLDNFQGNLIAIMIASIGTERSPESPHSIGPGVTNEASFTGFAHETCIEGLSIRKFSVQDANLTNVRFGESVVDALYVNSTSKFGITIPTVLKLMVVESNGTTTEHFDPRDIDVWMKAHSETEEERSTHNLRAVKLLDKVVRTFIRQHQIKKDPNDYLGKYLFENYWSEIEKILVKHDQVTEFSKDTSGKNAPFLRMHEPHSLLVRPETGSVQEMIWNEVGNIPVN